MFTLKNVSCVFGISLMFAAMVFCLAHMKSWLGNDAVEARTSETEIFKVVPSKKVCYYQVACD